MVTSIYTSLTTLAKSIGSSASRALRYIALTILHNGSAVDSARQISIPQVEWTHAPQPEGQEA